MISRSLLLEYPTPSISNFIGSCLRCTKTTNGQRPRGSGKAFNANVMESSTSTAGRLIGTPGSGHLNSIVMIPQAWMMVANVELTGPQHSRARGYVAGPVERHVRPGSCE